MSIFAHRDEKFNSAAVWNQFRQERWAAFALEVFADLPQKLWEFQVAAYLFACDYHAQSVRAVLEYAASWGTVELCRELQFDDSDRAAVERLLPGVPDHYWARLDDYVWATGGSNGNV